MCVSVSVCECWYDVDRFCEISFFDMWCRAILCDFVKFVIL